MKVTGGFGASGLLYMYFAVMSLSSSVLGAVTSTASNSNSASNTASTASTGSNTAASTSTTQTGSGSTTTAAASSTALPKLSNTIAYPTATVPVTSEAPYMQVSKLPEGTVFIVVGSILGFMAITVLAWRGMTAWSLRKSINRAALEDTTMDKKSLFTRPAPPMYKYSDGDSKGSLAQLGGNGGGKKRNIFAGLGGTSAQSLFFSPTAGAVGSGQGIVGNRGSSYLPAGYYAAGASAPGDGRGSAYIGSHPPRESISLSNLLPHSQGYARPAEYQPSPPDSPSFAPVPLGHNAHPSTSSLDLRVPNGRAPSAVLDDMFDGSAENLPRHGRR